MEIAINRASLSKSWSFVGDKNNEIWGFVIKLFAKKKKSKMPLHNNLEKCESTS